MKCPECRAEMEEVHVNVEGTDKRLKSLQCPKCDHFEFDEKSSKEVVRELRETPLKIKQKVIKMSADRLGIYFNKDLVRSLDIRKGEHIYISVPDKKHIVMELDR